MKLIINKQPHPHPQSGFTGLYSAYNSILKGSLLPSLLSLSLSLSQRLWPRSEHRLCNIIREKPLTQHSMLLHIRTICAEHDPYAVLFPALQHLNRTLTRRYSCVYPVGGTEFGTAHGVIHARSYENYNIL